jgi:hypothetical protein
MTESVPGAVGTQDTRLARRSCSAVHRRAAELVQAQADTTGFVVLQQWVEMLERRFPPALPDPDHTTA